MYESRSTAEIGTISISTFFSSPAPFSSADPEGARPGAGRKELLGELWGGVAIPSCIVTSISD